MLPAGAQATNLTFQISKIQLVGPIFVIPLLPDPKKEFVTIAKNQIQLIQAIMLPLGNKPIQITYHYNTQLKCLLPREIAIRFKKDVVLPLLPIPDIESLTGPRTFPRFIIMVGVKFSIDGTLTIQECLECTMPLFRK